MANIMVNIEEDNDSRAIVSQWKKWQIVESEPEDLFSVPKEIECNPMAPVTKKHRQLDVEKPPCTIPPLLPLQLTAPTQVPPNFQPNPKHCPVPTSQCHPKSMSESQQPQFCLQPKKSRPQDKIVATSKLSNPPGIPDEDDPMQEDHKNERNFLNGAVMIRMGAYLTFHDFLYSNPNTLQTVTIFMGCQDQHTARKAFIRITPDSQKLSCKCNHSIVNEPYPNRCPQSNNPQDYTSLTHKI